MPVFKLTEVRAIPPVVGGAVAMATAARLQPKTNWAMTTLKLKAGVILVATLADSARQAMPRNAVSGRRAYGRVSPVHTPAASTRLPIIVRTNAAAGDSPATCAIQPWFWKTIACRNRSGPMPSRGNAAGQPTSLSTPGATAGSRRTRNTTARAFGGDDGERERCRATSSGRACRRNP